MDISAIEKAKKNNTSAQDDMDMFSRDPGDLLEDPDSVEGAPIEPVAREALTKKGENLKLLDKLKGKYNAVKKRTKNGKRHLTSMIRNAIKGTNRSEEISNNQLGGTMEVDRIYTKSDTARLVSKDQLLASADFEENMDHTADFIQILDKLRKYALIDVTGSRGETREEVEGDALKKLLADLDRWRGAASNDTPITSRERGLCEAYYNRLKPLAEGSLQVDKNNGTFLDRSKAKGFVYKVDGKNPETVGMKDCSDRPIFAHEPSVNDIMQGTLGDCYLEASLSAMAENEPASIKNMIKDNGNGTVTVRFYDVKSNIKPQGNGLRGYMSGNPEGQQYDFKPLYVTIKKAAPTTQFSIGAFWVKLIEQAYAASGIPVSEKDAALNQKPDDEINYGRIIGGTQGQVLMQLTGRPVSELSFGGNKQDVKDHLTKLISSEAKSRRAKADADNAERVKSKKHAKKTMGDYIDKAKGMAGSTDKDAEGKYQKALPYMDMSWMAEEFIDSMGGEINFTYATIIRDVGLTVSRWLTDIAGFVQSQDVKDKNGELESTWRLKTHGDLTILMEKLKKADLDTVLREPEELSLKISTVLKQQDKTLTEDQIKAKTDEMVKKMKPAFIASLKKVIDSQKGMLAKEDMTADEFGIAAEGSEPDQIYKQIETWSAQKKTIAAATQQNSYFGKLSDRANMIAKQGTGEKQSKGLAGGHAYTVMGVQPRGNRRYIMLRNPWGSGVKEYVMDPNKKMDSRQMDEAQTCGIFLVEINDFAVNFANLSAV